MLGQRSPQFSSAEPARDPAAESSLLTTRARSYTPEAVTRVLLVAVEPAAASPPPSGPRSKPWELLRRQFSPAVLSRRDLPLFLVALVSAFSSIAALLLHAAGWIRMPYTASFVTLPGMVFLLCLIVWTGRAQRPLLFNRLWVGSGAGLVGLIAYDLIRFAVQTALPLRFDAFYSMAAFGQLMTGQPLDSPIGLTLGWAYHITNGWTFGIVYALLAGPARWWWGLAWGLILEIGMLFVYPGLFRPSPLDEFLAVSIIGHAAFGCVVGLWCQRYAWRVSP